MLILKEKQTRKNIERKFVLVKKALVFINFVLYFEKLFFPLFNIQ